MNERRFRIFVVDDDPVSQMITTDTLDDPRLEVHLFERGEECLAALDREPDLILMDVELPGMDGITLCRRIREAGNQHVQVIFVSSHGDLETRLKAYDAGGNDFLVKPYAPDELRRKVRLAEGFQEQRRRHAEESEYARQSAFTAMSYMGEQGTVIQFLRTSFGCTTPRQLAEALLSALGQYGLQGIVETRDESGVQCFSSKGPCTALEQSIIGHARGMERIFQFRDRLAVNYPHLTVLVTNLPLEDAERVGRLRDHLAILAEGAESRLTALDSERRRLAQADGILRAVAGLTRVLEEIDVRQAANRIQTLDAANQYLQDLDRAFVHLGLNETQESALIDMARRITERFSELQYDGKSLGDRLKQVTGELQRMVSGT